MGVTLKLSPQEMTTAAMIGVRRWLWIVSSGQRGKFSTNDFALGFAHAIMGAMYERLLARETNLHWPDGIGEFDCGDVGNKDIEVRGRTTLGPGLDLGIKHNDKMDKPFVLVHAETDLNKPGAPYFKMVGWVYGRDAWAEGKESGIKGVRFVPWQSPLLRPMRELMGAIRAVWCSEMKEDANAKDKESTDADRSADTEI